MIVTPEEFLSGLESLELCGNAGTPIEDSNVIQVTSWNLAIKRSKQLQWINFNTDRLNDFWDLGHFEKKFGTLESFEEIYDKNNTLMRDQVYEIVDKLKSKISCPTEERDHIATVLRGDLSAALREITYHEVTDATYFLLPASWIFKGHFPCGYEGNYPDGKLVIY
ncbi:hypothetical protein [Rubinisphaera sp.]|uniref:hypothetical protein n=1 Tax=Rubinisphaera sp. TaxID=2024857 RepID=UPI000C11B3D4|nr:hypothetical protein [Rubinisphaera sp.]MBV08513.1 hypothetical protein [Rubinisphaera sp.]HCS54733.1 hypothetical protein [Planctomycetaceae bacterium]|tara:strand:+ start:709 stop:1206 length:498 start_codon:yes stop_codon:yes gene_type:complete